LIKPIYDLNSIIDAVSLAIVVVSFLGVIGFLFCR